MVSSTESLKRMKTQRKSESFYLPELWPFIFLLYLTLELIFLRLQTQTKIYNLILTSLSFSGPQILTQLHELLCGFSKLQMADCITSWPSKFHIQPLLVPFSCRTLNNTKIETQILWAFSYNMHWIFIPFPPGAILCSFVNNHLWDLNFL